MISFGFGLRLLRAAKERSSIPISISKISRSRAGLRRCGQQAPQYGGLGQDQRFSALPVGAETGQGLAVPRHLLLVCLGRELLHRKEPFDEGWSVLEREGYDRGLSGSGWAGSCLGLDNRELEEVWLNRSATTSGERGPTAVRERQVQRLPPATLMIVG